MARPSACLIVKLLPWLVTSFPQVAASLNPSGRTESTIGAKVEIDLPDLCTSRETTASSLSWSPNLTFVSSQPFELNLLCQTLTGVELPSQETSSISGSLSRGSSSQYPRMSLIR